MPSSAVLPAPDPPSTTPIRPFDPGPPAGTAARPSTTDRALVAAVPAAVMLAFGLVGIRRQDSMWRDESTTYQVAHRSVPQILRLLGHADVVHGLYYLLVHAVFALWDGGLVALRLPSVLGMVAAAAGVGLIGHRLAGRGAGLAAGTAFTLFPAVQEYAQEGRSYALVCAFVVWATYALLGAVERPRPSAWCWYAAASSVACLLHEFAVFALLAHGVALLACRVGRRTGLDWTRAAGCAVLPVLPVVAISLRQSALVEWIGPPNPWVMLGLAALGGVCARVPLSVPPAVTGPVRLPSLAWTLLVVPPTTLLLACTVRPLYVDRYVLYAYVGLALLLGAAFDQVVRARALRVRVCRVGVVCLPARRTVVSLAVAAIVAALVPGWAAIRTPASRVDDTVAAARAVRELSRPGDGLLFLPGRRREPLMSRPQDFRGLRDLALARGPISSATLHGVERPAAGIRARMLTADRIVTVGDPPDQPKDATPQEITKRQVLRTRFHTCARRPVHGMVITLYARAGHC